MKKVIFLGPSLPVVEARQILDAIYLPPAAQADFLTATVSHRPDVIGLIDGLFLHSLSTWHKEILYALDQGILLYGASSMGALRAAETAAFGMIGVGEIYRQYASGELIDDDEVALSHASPEEGYKKQSEPMVNVRATLAAAEEAGLIVAAERERLIAVTKQIYFAERTFPNILQAARGELPAATREALARFVKTGYVDLKRRDAIELLETIERLPPRADAAPPPKTFAFRRSAPFDTLYDRDRKVDHDGTSLPLESIGNYAALHDPEFDDLNFHALNRAVVFAFAEILGVQVSAADVDAEHARFRKKRGLVDDAALASWLEKNHFDERELRNLMAHVAHCRRMHQWFLVAVWMQRSTRLILEEMRLTDRYTEWAAKAAGQERLLVHAKLEADHTTVAHRSLADLVAEHETWTDVSIPADPAAWADEVGFHSEGNFRLELGRAMAARRALLELLATSPSPAASAGRVAGHPETVGDER